MASVILVSDGGIEITVSTTREFNHRVYNLGQLPKTGTIEENFAILLQGAGLPTLAPGASVRVTDVIDVGSEVSALIRDALLPFWAAGEVVQAGEIRISPTGVILNRIADGTTRSTFDATEVARWTAVSGGSGGNLPHTHDEYATDAELATALGTYASDAELAAALAGYSPTSHNHDAAYIDPTELSTALAGNSSGDRARGNHTGTQTASTLSDLTETVQDIVGSLIVAGTNVTVSYDDTAGTFTINSTGGTGGITDPEIVRDTIGGALVAGAGIQITINDAGDTLTIASTAVLPTRTVTAGTGLTGGGDLSANRSFAVAYGTAAGTAAQGNDSRLSDARTPTAHVHAIGDTTGLQAALDLKAAQVNTPRILPYSATMPIRPAWTGPVVFQVPQAVADAAAKNGSTAGGTAAAVNDLDHFWTN